MRQQLRQGVTAVALFSFISLAAAEPLSFATRPWLQYLSRDSAAVFFETEKPVAAVVEYGKGRAMDKREGDEANTSHRLVLKGLDPGSIYSYRIRTRSGAAEAVSDIYEFDTTFNFTPYSVAPVGNSYTADPAAQLYARAAEQILARTGVTQGYCLVLGCGQGQLAYELVRRSDLTVIGADENAGNIAEARPTGPVAGQAAVHRMLRQPDRLRQHDDTGYVPRQRCGNVPRPSAPGQRRLPGAEQDSRKGHRATMVECRRPEI